MAGDKDALIGMGFEAARVDWALRETKNAGLQPALDFLFAHTDDPIPDPSTSTSATVPSAPATGEANDEDDEEIEALKAVYGTNINVSNTSTSGENVEAKSIKCSQCGKIFKNTALANFHAEKSGHDQFEESTEEIKPLTEEEKKVKLAELREKLAEKRAAKSKQDSIDAKANEAIRRKGGKDIGQLKEDMKAKEAIKAAEQARKDKIEDAKAKAAIRAQIEADKRERKEKAEREKALRAGQPIPEPSASTPVPAPATAPAAASKDYKETRLQIRLASGGQPYVTTLSSESTLRDVAEYLASQSLNIDVETVTFTMTFPRKQFTHADFSRTLKELGLTPSAVLIAS